MLLKNKSTPIVRDWAVFGFAVGAATSVLKTLTNYALLKMGVHVVHYGNIGSGLIMGTKPRIGRLIAGPPKPPEVALGYLVDTLAGGAIGAAICRLVQSATPPGNEIIKGTGAGALIAVGTLAAGKMLKMDAFTKITPAAGFALIGTGALYGTIEGIAMAKYGASLITQSHPVIVEQMTTREFNRRRLASRPEVR